MLKPVLAHTLFAAAIACIAAALSLQPGLAQSVGGGLTSSKVETALAVVPGTRGCIQQIDGTGRITTLIEQPGANAFLVVSDRTAPGICEPFDIGGSCRRLELPVQERKWLTEACGWSVGGAAGLTEIGPNLELWRAGTTIASRTVDAMTGNETYIAIGDRGALLVDPISSGATGAGLPPIATGRLLLAGGGSSDLPAVIMAGSINLDRSLATAARPALAGTAISALGPQGAVLLGDGRFVGPHPAGSTAAVVQLLSEPQFAANLARLRAIAPIEAELPASVAGRVYLRLALNIMFTQPNGAALARLGFVQNPSLHLRP